MTEEMEELLYHAQEARYEYLAGSISKKVAIMSIQPYIEKYNEIAKQKAKKLKMKSFPKMTAQRFIGR